MGVGKVCKAVEGNAHGIQQRTNRLKKKKKRIAQQYWNIKRRIWNSKTEDVDKSVLEDQHY